MRGWGLHQMKEKYKREKKSMVNEEGDVEILFLSEPPKHLQKPTFQPSSELIRIVCNEHEFILPENVAKRCGFISRLFHNSNSFQENQKGEVVLHELFDIDCLEEVFRFCAMDCKINPQTDNSEGSYSQSSKDRFVFVFELNPETVVGTLHAAHFLSVAPLVHSAAHYISERMGNEVELFEGLSEEVLSEIFSIMYPKKLAKIEEEAKKQDINLDSETLQQVWKKKCDNKGWIVTYEGSIDWKSVYFGQELQEMLISLGPEDAPKLITHLTEVGHYISKHYAHPDNSLKWWSYLHYLTNIQDLDLSHNLFSTNEMQSLIHFVLPNLTKLNKLVFSDCGIDENSIVLLASYILSLPNDDVINKHTTLTSIDLTWNLLTQNSADILGHAVFTSIPQAKVLLHFNYRNRNMGERQNYEHLANKKRGEIDLISLNEKYPQIQV
eukprot:TRINITY_DN2510_c0_g2_i2.p1 TRINITY_DN2510_c0_g2~~TRINITY_DN2510_c0_g2_i2.p1  ORF type:complete len:439 (+),score=87.15 TRINITY_DN2510_c0_g2_i2:162-1478(+)